MALIQGDYQDVVRILRANVNDDRANSTAITGPVRKGKSNLAYRLVTELCPDFTYERNYLGNPRHMEAIKAIKDLPQKSVLWFDEAEKILSAEKRWEKEQWLLLQLFNQFASKNQSVFFCTPSFQRIDSRWRNVHINYWIFCYSRGRAVLLKNRDIQSSSDVWGLREMRKVEEKAKAVEVGDEYVLKRFDANPCAMFYFNFPDWEPSVKDEYLKHKDASQIDLLAEIEKFGIAQGNPKTMYLQKAQAGLARIGSYFNLKWDIPTRDISALAGYSDSTFNKFITEFEDSVSSGEIPAEELPNKFFPPEYVEILKARSKNRRGL
jgi:hypothetical protein